VVCGRRRELNPGASIYNRICDQEWNTAIGQTLSCGGDSLIRVEAFEAVGGFSAGLIAGEEPELCLRLREKGWKIWRLDAEMTVHDVAMTRFSQWWRRAARFGYGTAELSVLHWKSSSDTWRRQLASSIIWGGAIPLGICVTSVLSPVVLAASIIYPIQVCRIALARRSFSNSWEYAVLVMLAKFAEFSGLMKFAWRRLVRKPNQLIEYK
jgi:cellulose synthase/poly-beta-1,6-N-acetylglucosamine synthase-like glycosyltransferase